MIARAASNEPTMPDEVVVTHDSDDRCSKVLRSARFSPVSIDHVFPDPTEVRRQALMPMCTLSLMFVYAELVTRDLWNARFCSGSRNGTQGGPAPVRTLATRHLRHPSTDGWNVVAGAAALAQAWALSGEARPRDVHEVYDFSKDTRIRLAVCLCVAWKFERCMSTHFPRKFYTMEPSLFSPHTHELAFVGYSFLTLDEQVQFGEWGCSNSQKIHRLYDEMLALEVDLLLDTNVMALMTRNEQVLAEERIAQLLAGEVVSADAAMAMRAVLPFFRIAALDGKSSMPSAGVLVCASMLCVSVPGTARPYVLHCAKTVRAQFTQPERRGAYAILHKATHLRGVAVSTVASSCYGDKEWVHYPFVCADALRIALFMAHDVSK